MLRLISKFYDSIKKGNNPPIPNLGKTEKALKKEKEISNLQRILKFAIQ
jgi:hypothetical protein